MVSFKPSEMSEGRGRLDDANVRWEELEFVMYDFQGATDPRPCLCITTQDLDNENAEPQEEYIVAGFEDDFQPSEDGKTLVQLGTRGIDKSSNFGILMASLVEAGFPEEDIDDEDITTLAGLECHMLQVPVTRRGKPVMKKGTDEVVMTLAADKILSLPGEEKKGKGKGKAAKGKTAKGKGGKSTKTSKKEDTGGDVEDKTVEAILEIVTEAGEDGIEKKKLPTKLFSILKDDPDKSKVVKLALDDKFLGDEERPWEYEDGTLSVA